MATACKTPVAAAAAVLLLLIVSVAVAPASASSMTGYSQSGCSGNRRTWGCGACYNLAGYKGGYFFDYSGGQVGRLYRGSNCQGSYDSVGRDVRRCSPYAYNSFRIMC
ncbi:unnamed protein product [Spirodela intermedia]|uniref:Uncharacterized protein n=2 Tax=Spirodela intermedia TaxID=51605 RepID=A0ABN7E9L0_SPIIN|nr:unnamed protein product [Spirodela intermedia]CAA7394253.1 unnamed protein product [Spirodela intermedia]